MGREAAAAALGSIVGIAAICFGEPDKFAISLSHRVAGTLIVSVTDPLAAFVFALTAGVAPPIGVATPLFTDAVEREMEAVGCDICVDLPVRSDQEGALRAVFERKLSIVRYDASLDLLLDPIDHAARVGSTVLRLSPREFSLLYCLSLHEGAPTSSDALLREAWGAASRDKPKQALEFCVSQLRKKLLRAESKATIRTARNFGYWLCALPSESTAG